MFPVECSKWNITSKLLYGKEMCPIILQRQIFMKPQEGQLLTYFCNTDVKQKHNYPQSWQQEKCQINNKKVSFEYY